MVLAAALCLGGCGSAPAATVATAVSTSSSADGTRIPVTVPALGDEPSIAASAAPAPTSRVDSSVPTVAVKLVNCADCTVIATHADVVPGYSAALITSDGRGALLSVDGGGTVVGITNVPYGTTFAVPPDGQLTCGAGGRCVVLAAQPDGRAILSAFALGSSGAWVDLTGSTGFVSATARGQAVSIEGAVGVAIQVSDGTTTVWTVLAWNGQAFNSIGCTADATTPDLTALTPDACLS
jgi:hypothetical protein